MNLFGNVGTFTKANLMKKTLVLGASLNPSRYSHMAINRLVNNNYEVVAIGLREGKVAGIEIIKEKKVFEDIDTITLYLNPQRQKDYYNYIVSLNPNRVIFNPGTENSELYQLLSENNIESEVACTLVLLSTNQY
ncbi:MAG: putative CoA-binding protein [Parvicella sp.]|jgi:predicted CoA-binding protein